MVFWSNCWWRIVIGEIGAGVADDGVGRDVVIEDLFGLLGDNGEVLDLAKTTAWLRA